MKSAKSTTYVEQVSRLVREFNKNNPLKKLQNQVVKMIEPKYPILGWTSNYLIFTLAIYFSKLVLLRFVDIPVLPIINNHLVGGLIGAVLQGKADCPAQLNLEDRHPFVTPMIGFGNGVLCCYIMSLFKHVLLFTATGQALAQIVPALDIPSLCSAVVTSLPASKIMCKIESIFGKIADMIFPTTPIAENTRVDVFNTPKKSLSDRDLLEQESGVMDALKLPSTLNCCGGHVKKLDFESVVNRPVQIGR